MSLKDALLTKIDSNEPKETYWLHIACRNGWLDAYTLLIEKYGLDPWSVDGIHGALPLHFACTSGNIELVQYLISQYYNALSHVSIDGLTTLHCAVMGGLVIVKCLVEEHGLKPMLSVDTPRIMLFAYNNWDEELMKYLIVDQKCSIVINDSTGYTLLHTACKDGAFNRFKFLLEQCHCKPYVTTKNNDTVLHSLLSSFCSLNLNISEFLAAFPSTDPLAFDCFGRTAVDYAIMSMRPIKVLQDLLDHCKLNPADCAHILSITYHHWSDDVMKYLIKYKKCGTITNCNTGNTVLHNACRDMDISKLRFLVEECHLFPQHVVNNHNDTLIHAFSSSAWHPIDFEVLSYLCDKCGCDPFQRNSSNHTPLECAIIHGHEHNAVSIVRHFVEYFKFAVLLDTSSSSRIISLAYKHWNDEMMKYLIVEAGFYNRSTKMYELCRNNKLARLKFLVQECKCDPNVVNKNGETLLHTVCMSEKTDLDILSFLIESLVPHAVKHHDHFGHTPFSYAIMNQRLNFIKLIVEQRKYFLNSISIKMMCLAYDYWNEAIIKYLILEAQFDIITENNSGDTLLHKACRESDCARLHFLIKDCLCNPHVAMNKKGESLLHTACRYASDKPLHCFHLLQHLCVECGCSPTFTHDDVSTAFKCAIQYEEGLSLAKHLVENYRDSIMFIMSRRAFFSVCWNRSILRFLIVEEGFFVFNTNTGDTLLHKACETANLEKFYFLLQKCECDPYIVNKKGESILHAILKSLSLCNKHLEMLAYLCEQYKFNCDTIDIDSRTVLLTVCNALRPDNYVSCVNVMRAFAKKYKPDITNEDGSTFLHQLCCKSYYEPEVVEFVCDLIRNEKCDPLTKDSFSNTILHSVLSTTKHYLPHILHLIYFLIDDCGIDISGIWHVSISLVIFPSLSAYFPLVKLTFCCAIKGVKHL